MKIFTSLFLVLLMCFLLVACSSAPPAGDSALSENGAAENLEPSYSQNVTTESGELPPATGSDAFVAAFKDNAVDTEYLTSIDKSMDIVSMVNVTNTAAIEWETQLNYTFSVLIDSLEGEEKERVELSQSAWSDGLEAVIDEIRESAKNTGSTAGLDVAYKIMLIYRGRTTAILEQLFEITGEITLSSGSTGEAVG